MSNSIFEEEGKKPVAGGMATAQRQVEKQARQLAYDTRYQVKKEVGGKPVNAVVMKKLLLQRLQKSTAAPAVKARAKQMLLGEDYIASGTEFATESVANAMFKVFVEGRTIFEENVANNVEEAYLSEMEKRGGEKFKVRVTDPKTGNSYIRYATMEKITQLRLKGLHIEKTKYGTPREDEARRGSQTASALGGGKRAKRDYDGDGKVESSSKEHAGAVHNAIRRATGGTPDGKDTRKTVSASYEPNGKLVDEARKRGLVGNQKRLDVAEPYNQLTAADFKKLRKEEFITDAAGEDSNTKKIDVMKGKNKVVVFPSDSTIDRQGTGASTPRSVYAHTELEGEVIVETGYSKFLAKVQNLREMSVSINQQQAAGAALSAKRGKTDPSTLKGAAREMYDSMTEKQLRDFAKTKHKGLPEKVKEAVEDTRADKTYHQVIKNKLRSLGDKNPMLLIPPEELEKTYNKISTSDMIKKEKINGMCEGLGLSVTASRALGKVFANPRTSEAEAAKAAQRNLTDPVGFAVKGAIRQAGQALGARPEQNKQMIDKRRPQTPLQKQVAARTQQVVNQSYEPEGEVVSEKDEAIEAKFKKAKTPHLLRKFRQEHPGSRQDPKKPGAKETVAQARERQTHTQVRRVVKYGLTKKEKKESDAIAKYDSPRD